MQNRLLPRPSSAKPFLHVMLLALLISWLYSGFFRVYVFPAFSNQLYFIPVVILFIIFVIAFQDNRISNGLKLSFLLLFFVCLLFQFLHFVYGNIETISIFYGIAIYVIPLSIVLVAPLICECIRLEFFKIVIYSIPINALLCVLQTYVPDSRFTPDNEVVQIMTSSGGYARAFGTFSHPTGYAIYLSLALAIVLSMPKSLPSKLISVMLFAILVQTVLSGSRTALAYNCFILLGFLFMKSKNVVGGIKLYSKKKLVLFILLSLSVSFLLFSSTIFALIERIKQASAIEKSGYRLISIFDFGSIYQSMDFWGQGLGSKSSGIARSFGSEWIETPYAANFIEAGLLLGLVFFSIRVLVLAILIRNALPVPEVNKFSILAIALLPCGLFGTVFGQATVSQGFWFVTAICLAGERPTCIARNECCN